MNGSLAQLVERHVYTVDVIGSIPVGPTKKSLPIRGQTARTGGDFYVSGTYGVRPGFTLL